MTGRSVRRTCGALVYDGPRLLRCLLTQAGWCRMRNRRDRITVGPDGRGVRCELGYSEPLHVCGAFPHTARWLLRKALLQWPLGSADPVPTHPPPARPQVSFIIGHRGLERLPQLLQTLESVRWQRGVGTECIVVEQDPEPRIRGRLPEWVRYTQAPLSTGERRFSRSAAFNAGEPLARGEVLILQDGDLLVPATYAAEAWRLYQEGYEVIRLARFVFYLDRASSEQIRSDGFRVRGCSCEEVRQNAVGGTLAVSRGAFERLGGMDEDFVGWGGEDNEFWDRCRACRVWDYGFLPFLHLWHPSLADKDPATNPALALLARKLAIPAAERMDGLRARRKSAGAPDVCG